MLLSARLRSERRCRGAPAVRLGGTGDRQQCGGGGHTQSRAAATQPGRHLPAHPRSRAEPSWRCAIAPEFEFRGINRKPHYGANIPISATQPIANYVWFPVVFGSAFANDSTGDSDSTADPDAPTPDPCP
jgi:hypothetical protein